MKKIIRFFLGVVLIISNADARVVSVARATNTRYSIVNKDAIIKKLEEQLSLPADSTWHERVDNLLFDLAMVDRKLASDYLKKVHEKLETVRIAPSKVVMERPLLIPVEKKEPVIQVESKVSSEPDVSEVDKEAIIKELDVQLLLADSEWDEKVDDLLFDLSTVDRKMASEYAKKIRVKIVSFAVKSSEVIEKPVVLPTESAPIVSSVQPSDEPMKKGTTVAPRKGAPSGGPAKKLGVPSGGPKGASIKPMAMASKVVEQIFSLAKLKELDNDKLLGLLTMLLEKLPSNWNGQIVEKVEEKTKYGSKVYNVYGAPIPKWSNDINTLKKVLILNNVMPEEDVTKKIADRIAQVRSEKNVKPAVVAVEEEKPKEELTEQDLIRLLKLLLAEPKKDQIGWVVSVKGNIKSLDKTNHEAAFEYHERFIKLTGERPFLKL